MTHDYSRCGDYVHCNHGNECLIVFNKMMNYSKNFIHVLGKEEKI